MNIIDGVLVSFDSPPKDVVISGVRVIGERAFQGSDIRSVDIRDVVDIRARAFMDCANLRNVTLPSSLRRIDDFAFSGTHFHEIALPYGVELGDSVFFDSWLSMVIADTDDDWRVPLYKLPPSCKIVGVSIYTALKKLGADKQWRQNEEMLRIRIPRRVDIPRISKRQAKRGKAKRGKAKRVKQTRQGKPQMHNRRPRTPVPKGPRGKGECTICLKPSCEHLNISRRLGAPVMW